MKRRDIIQSTALATSILFAGCNSDLVSFRNSPNTTTNTACESIQVPDKPTVQPGSELFYSKMLSTVRSLGNSWEKTQIERVDDMATTLRQTAVNLLLPGIRDELLPDSIEATKDLIEATTTSFEIAGAAESTLLIGEFRGKAQEIRPTSYYREFERPFDAEPQSKSSFVSPTDPNNRPYYTLTNVLEENIIGVARGEIDLDEFKQDGQLIHDVLAYEYIEPLKNTEFVTEDDNQFTACASKYNGQDIRVVPLLLNLELIKICSETLVNAAEATRNQSTGTADSTNETTQTQRSSEWTVIDNFEAGSLDAAWGQFKAGSVLSGREGFEVRSGDAPEGQYALRGIEEGFREYSGIERDDFTIDEDGATLRLHVKLGPILSGSERANKIHVIGNETRIISIDQKDRPGEETGALIGNKNAPNTVMDSITQVEFHDIRFTDNRIGTVVVDGNTIASEMAFLNEASEISAIRIYQGHYAQPAEIIVDNIMFREPS